MGGEIGSTCCMCIPY